MNQAQKIADELIKPYARAALRRVFSHNLGLSRLAHTIEEERDLTKDKRTLDILEKMVIEQIWIASDAIEDWRDIIPQDVSSVA